MWLMNFDNLMLTNLALLNSYIYIYVISSYSEYDPLLFPQERCTSRKERKKAILRPTTDGEQTSNRLILKNAKGHTVSIGRGGPSGAARPTVVRGWVTQAEAQIMCARGRRADMMTCLLMNSVRRKVKGKDFPHNIRT